MRTAASVLALASTVLGQSLTEVLSSNPDLSNLTALLPAETAETLGSAQNITLLAPSNAAIGNLSNMTAQMLGTNTDLLQAILSYHVLQGNFSTVENLTFFNTSLGAMGGSQYANVTGGQRVSGVSDGETVTFYSGLLQNSTVTNASIPFDQGTVHIIDRVLTLPQNVTSTGSALNLTSAVGAITALGLNETLTNTADLTFFLPNNAAFQRIGGNLANLSTEELTSILSYHVVPALGYSTGLMNGTTLPTLNEDAELTITLDGEDVYVNSARVIRPNILVSNGVVHVIDRVLNPANATAAPNTATTEESFPDATSASDEPFTSGVPTPTSEVPSEATGGAAAGESSADGAFRPLETGAMAMAALFAGGAAVLNL